MIILLNRCGQLGNRLFMFANFIALAQKYDLKITNLAFFEFQRHFTQTEQDLFCRYPYKKFKFIKHREVNYLLYLIFFYFFKILNKINIFKKRLMIVDLDNGHLKLDLDNFDSKALQIAKNGLLVVVYGWVDVFTKIDPQQSAAIKDYFIIKNEHKKNVDQLIQKARKLGEIIVGVHIRHGDYARFRKGKYFYSLEAYVKLLNQCQGLVSNKRVVFLICSNELQKPDCLKGINHIFGTGHRVEDLYALAHCDYLIGPPSTYTMWASFYGHVPLYSIENAEHKFCLDDFKVFCAEKNE
jgi:hypothetical protein